MIAATPSTAQRPPAPSRAAKVFLGIYLLAFLAFALARVAPVNSQLAENTHHHRGDLDRRVYRIFNLAQERAAKPFFEVRDHGIFHGRNPGIFIFVAELFARAGASSPLPNQIFCIALWAVGLVLCFLWMLHIFESELFAATALVLLLTTPFLLYHCTTIHHGSYAFLFFHLTLFCFARYLMEGRQRRWLLYTCGAYFLLSQSYWMYYMSAYLMLIALQLVHGRPSLRVSLILALPPVAGALSTFAQAAYARGSLEGGYRRIAEIAVARTGDWRLEDSTWYPDRHYVTDHRLSRYPSTVMTRVGSLSGYPFSFFVSLTLATLLLAGRRAVTEYRWLPVAILAGLSWNLVMVQHTVIHKFAGMYGYFAWMLIAAAFACELRRALRPERARWALFALALPLVYAGLQRHYLPSLERYAENIAAGEDVAARRRARRADREKENERKRGDKAQKRKSGAP